MLSFYAYAQKQPQVYKSYWNNENKFIINHLVLSTDSTFFDFSSCECGEAYYGRGTWRIKGKMLYLKGWDSTRAFPRSQITLLEGEANDSVTIAAYDYFSRPIKYLSLGLITHDTTEFEPEYRAADTLGKLKISKKDYRGFFLVYESKDNTGLRGKDTPYQDFEKNTREVVIRINYAGSGFNGEPIPFTYPSQSFRIKKDRLYGKGNRPIFVINPQR